MTAQGPGERMLRLATAVVACLVVTALHAQATTPAAGIEGDFEMRDFKFTDGSTLPVLRIHYTTLGTPKKDARGVVRNAVLILHEVQLHAFRQVGKTRQAIIENRTVHQLRALVHELFKKSDAHAHGRSADVLAFGQRRVDRKSNVTNRR